MPSMRTLLSLRACSTLTSVTQGTHQLAKTLTRCGSPIVRSADEKPGFVASAAGNAKVGTLFSSTAECTSVSGGAARRRKPPYQRGDDQHEERERCEA